MVPTGDAVSIPAAGVALPAIVGDAATGTGVVVFEHGSGSSRLSPRNRRVADDLAAAGFSTVLFDLLVGDEADDRAKVFDIGLLGQRLGAAVHWAADRFTASIGLFGASTGAAAALTTAADLPESVSAVVSRGGRPDLAGTALPSVTAPSLLIVGGEDRSVLDLNRSALAAMRGPHELVVVPGAGHLFIEADTMDAVTTLATLWFGRHLVVDA